VGFARVPFIRFETGAPPLSPRPVSRQVDRLATAASDIIISPHTPKLRLLPARTLARCNANLPMVSAVVSNTQWSTCDPNDTWKSGTRIQVPSSSRPVFVNWLSAIKIVFTRIVANSLNYYISQVSPQAFPYISPPPFSISFLSKLSPNVWWSKWRRRWINWYAPRHIKYVTWTHPTE
jgi:hypothetical protein